LTIANIDSSPEIFESLKIDGQTTFERKKGQPLRFVSPASKTTYELPHISSDVSALMLEIVGSRSLFLFLSNIRVFRIDPLSAKEPDSYATDNSELDPHGRNVATILSKMEKDDGFREQVMEWVELIVPGMEGVNTEKQRLDGSTILTFKEEGTKARFPARLISDGTIYALCILTAVLSRADGVGITIIEEPERGIHPKAIGELVQLMRENANESHPIFLTTHSESVVRNLEVEELCFVDKQQGKTKVHYAAEAGIDKRQIALDTAWLTNLFDGGLPW
jgi:predicted ATPase